MCGLVHRLVVLCFVFFFAVPTVALQIKELVETRFLRRHAVIIDLSSLPSLLFLFSFIFVSWRPGMKVTSMSTSLSCPPPILLFFPLLALLSNALPHPSGSSSLFRGASGASLFWPSWNLSPRSSSYAPQPSSTLLYYHHHLRSPPRKTRRQYMYESRPPRPLSLSVGDAGCGSVPGCLHPM